MSVRKGTLLERYIELIFKNIGFETRQPFIYRLPDRHYEIDVMATDTVENLTIAIQCKQYENSPFKRDWIHEWADKKRLMRDVDKVLIAFWGDPVSEDHKKLAHELGLTIWDHLDINKYHSLSAEDRIKARNLIFEHLNIQKSQNIEVDKVLNSYVTPKLSISSIVEHFDSFNVEFKNLDIKEFLFPSYFAKIKLDSKRPFDNFVFSKELGHYSCQLYKDNIEIVEDSGNLFKNLSLGSNIPGNAHKAPLTLSIKDINAILMEKGHVHITFYHSNFADDFEELKGVYNHDKQDLIGFIHSLKKNEIEGKGQRIEKRYTPDFEYIKQKIRKLNHDIELSQKRLQSYNVTVIDVFTEQSRTINSLHKKANREKARIRQKEMDIEFQNKELKNLQNKLNDEKQSINDSYLKEINDSIQRYEFYPKDNEILICDPQILWFPVCDAIIKFGRDGITGETEIILDHNGIRQLGSCSDCKKTINSFNDFNICSDCLAISCKDHTYSCNICERKFCAKEVKICPNCNKPFCNHEKQMKCTQCNQIFDEKCVKECSKCKKIYCATHIHYCDVCSSPNCPDHLKECRICKKQICSNCIQICSGCHKEACKEDYYTCELCGKSYCKDCIRIRDGLISSDMRCIYCIEKLANRPLKDKIKGVFK